VTKNPSIEVKPWPKQPIRRAIPLPHPSINGGHPGRRFYWAKVPSTFAQTLESKNDSPPEAGFARREAYKERNGGRSER
jgi:hypothetical protein